jgi:hypothetical protein
VFSKGKTIWGKTIKRILKEYNASAFVVEKSKSLN